MKSSKDRYWVITIWYDNKDITKKYQGNTSHIIRAKSEKEALRIREKYGIAYPIRSDRIWKVECFKMDSRRRENRIRLHNRRLHATGSIWYEENDELKTEEWKERKA